MTGDAFQDFLVPGISRIDLRVNQCQGVKIEWHHPGKGKCIISKALIDNQSKWENKTRIVSHRECPDEKIIANNNKYTVS